MSHLSEGVQFANTLLGYLPPEASRSMCLELRNVTKRFGSVDALTSITCQLDKGLVGFLGPNGAGKTTLLRLIATLSRPTSGSITWDGVDTAAHPLALRSALGYLPQDFGAYPQLSALEFLSYMAAAKGLRHVTKNQLSQHLDQVHLGDTGNKRIGSFSGGMKRRLGIAQSLLNNPRLLILDEPAEGLDPAERFQLHNLLSSIAADRLVLLSTHIVSDIDTLADRIFILLKGALVFDNTFEHLIELVAGKVWEVSLPRCAVDAFLRCNATSAIRFRNAEAHIRVVSDVRPQCSIGLEPTLADAYLWISDGSRDALNERNR